MLAQHLIRYGLFGHVGRFASPEGRTYPRRSRVVCRTARGLEVGEVLTVAGSDDGELDGTVLRPVSVQDELLLARLQKHKLEALEACQRKLSSRQLDLTLMDVEPLFDGQSLIFYFLGELTSEVEALTAELAEAYEARVQFRKFTETLLAGCGPGCGTEEAENGCASGACSSCAVASACGATRR